MSARLGELSDWKTEAKARGIELTLPEIRDGEEAVLKRAYHYGKSVGHPSKMLQCSMRVEKDERTGKTVSRHIQDFGGSDMVYTCPPGYIAQLMEKAGELEPFDPNAIDRASRTRRASRSSCKLPSFRQAYEFDGMTPDQFAHFGVVQGDRDRVRRGDPPDGRLRPDDARRVRAAGPAVRSRARPRRRSARPRMRWNRRDPETVALAYTPDSRWRNRERVPRRPRGDCRVPAAQVGEGAGLPADQGAVGVHRRPHRGALRLRVA